MGVAGIGEGRAVNRTGMIGHFGRKKRDAGIRNGAHMG